MTVEPSIRTTAKRPAAAGRTYMPLFTGTGSAFVLAAAAVAVANAREPFDHGWWLVAYLALVGGLSQLILGGGQFLLAARLEARVRGDRVLVAELLLWNVGTVLVPVGVLSEAPGAVASGSVLLMAALALFAGTTRALPRQRRGPDRLWAHAYRAVVVFMAVSVIVGTGLGGALPWQ